MRRCHQQRRRACPYHAWSYELDGRLRLAPRFEATNFEPSEIALLRVRHEVWGGWLFVNVSGDAPPLHEHLGSLTAQLANWECERLVVAAAHRYELAANWKIAVENYNECYHCPLIHPELARVSPPDSGDNHEGPGAWVGGTMDLAGFAATMSLRASRRACRCERLTAEQRRQVLYLAVFPNLLVSLHPDYVLTHRMEPVSAARTIVECQWLFAPEAVEAPEFDPSYAVDFWDLTNRQDWAAVESVQRGLSHPAFLPGVLAEQESDVYRFVTMVARGYRGEPLRGGPCSTLTLSGLTSSSVSVTRAPGPGSSRFFVEVNATCTPKPSIRTAMYCRVLGRVALTEGALLHPVRTTLSSAARQRSSS